MERGKDSCAYSRSGKQREKMRINTNRDRRNREAPLEWDVGRSSRTPLPISSPVFFPFAAPVKPYGRASNSPLPIRDLAELGSSYPGLHRRLSIRFPALGIFPLFDPSPPPSIALARLSL